MAPLAGAALALSTSLPNEPKTGREFWPLDADFQKKFQAGKTERGRAWLAVGVLTGESGDGWHYARTLDRCLPGRPGWLCFRDWAFKAIDNIRAWLNDAHKMMSLMAQRVLQKTVQPALAHKMLLSA
jgi:hypothetical protein